MAVKLKCPSCEEKFTWQFNDVSRWPSHCPCCGAYMGNDRADDDVVMPNIFSAKSRSADKLYRDMEAGSERRAEIAAEQAGCSVADMSGLKITNLNDRKDAEIMAIPERSVVTDQMDFLKSRGGDVGFAGSNGSEFAAGTATGAVTINGKTTTGIEPRAGSRTLAGIQQLNGRG